MNSPEKASSDNEKAEVFEQWKKNYQAILQGPLANFRGMRPAQPRLLDYNYSKQYDSYRDVTRDPFVAIPEVEAFLQEVGKVEDKDVAMFLLHQDRQLFPHFNQAMRDDKDIAMYAVSNDAHNFSCLSEELKNDEDVCLALAGDAARQVNNEWHMIVNVPEKFRNDRDFVLKFIKRNPTQVLGVSRRTPFGKDEGVMLQAVEDALMTGIPDVIAFTIGASNINKNSIMKLIKNHPDAKQLIISSISSELEKDPDILNA